MKIKENIEKWLEESFELTKLFRKQNDMIWLVATRMNDLKIDEYFSKNYTCLPNYQLFIELSSEKGAQFLFFDECEPSKISVLELDMENRERIYHNLNDFIDKATEYLKDATDATLKNIKDKDV